MTATASSASTSVSTVSASGDRDTARENKHPNAKDSDYESELDNVFIYSD